MNNINDKAEMILDKMLKNMDDNTKNTLIRLLMTHDPKDVWIQTVPVYEDICHEGYVLCRYIKEVRYAVGLKHEVLKENKGEGKFDYNISYSVKEWYDERRESRRVHKSELSNALEDIFRWGGYDVKISCVERRDNENT